MSEHQITVEQIVSIISFHTSNSEVLIEKHKNEFRRVINEFAREQRADATRELQRENAELKQAKLGTDLLNAELVGDLASAKWRLAEAEKDAERYRWLSERMQITNRTALNGTTRPALSMRVFCSFLDSTEIVKKTEGERVAFDAAIDAARTAQDQDKGADNEKL